MVKQDLPGTADEDTIQLYEQLREDEVLHCKTCQLPETFKPRHFLSHQILETDGGRQLLVPTGKNCGGNGRRFDVEKKEFVGYSHCTCDSCF